MGPAPGTPARHSGYAGGTGNGLVVHRRKQHPSESGRGWSPEKGGPEDEPEDHALGRSRGGYGTKIHLITDGKGIPLAVQVSPGQRHESTCFESTMGAVRLDWPPRISGDKGYSYPRIRTWLQEHRIEDIIPMRSDQMINAMPRNFDRETYRRRNVIERAIGWLKECRRIATRFEKLAVNFLAMLKIAIVERYLRLMDRA